VWGSSPDLSDTAGPYGADPVENKLLSDFSSQVPDTSESLELEFLVITAIPDLAQLGVVAARGLLRAGAGGGTTRLYRAVSHGEFDQLMKTGKFAAGPNSLGGKFFAESAEHAAQWGERLQGTGNHRIITADVPTSVAD
jgi:hypothetical protein